MSVLGNFNREEAAEFLKSFAEGLQPADSMIIGVDSCQNPDKV
jgi:L-histidine Nalpha-methyltransferase / hercynylcysteine S-oxide synthase